jgi:hypothetical protein
MSHISNTKIKNKKLLKKQMVNCSIFISSDLCLKPVQYKPKNRNHTYTHTYRLQNTQIEHTRFTVVHPKKWVTSMLSSVSESSTALLEYCSLQSLSHSQYTSQEPIYTNLAQLQNNNTLILNLDPNRESH